MATNNKIPLHPRSSTPILHLQLHSVGVSYTLDLQNMNNNNDPLPISSPKFIPTNKKDSPESTTSSRVRYKFWALSVIILLAFWSMLTGTVTLRFSAGNLHRFSDESPVHQDLDVLEIEEREKVVEHMWDVYTNSRRIGLPRFWQRAFGAAFEDFDK